jgi:hypothetical protein
VVLILVAGDLALQSLSVNCLKGWRTPTSLGAERLVPTIKHSAVFGKVLFDIGFSVFSRTDRAGFSNQVISSGCFL